MSTGRKRSRAASSADAYTRNTKRRDSINRNPTLSFTTTSTSGRAKVTNVNGPMFNGDVTVHLNSDRVEEVKRWLAAPDSSNSYHAAFKKHHTLTGSWLFDKRQFRNWKTYPSYILWLCGASGCGKTVICAAAVDIIEKHCSYASSSAYAYFFFDSRSGEESLSSHDGLIRSLILQLMQQGGEIPDAIMRTTPSLVDLQDALLSIVRGFSHVYIIIDALDECTAQTSELLAWIKNISHWNGNKLHILLSSRQERVIEDHLLSKVRDLDAVYFAAHQSNVDNDIGAFVDQQISDIPDWDDDTRKSVKSALMERAGGMFRLVAMQIVELSRCDTEEELTQQLHSLPTGLEEIYERLLTRSDRPEHLKRFLFWLIFAARPIKLDELAEVVAVDHQRKGGPRYTRSKKYFSSRVALTVCSGLVTEFEGIIKLSHITVKEYLISARLSSSPAAYFTINTELSQSSIAQTCLAYLLHLGTFKALTTEILASFPLALYAAEHWTFHVKECINVNVELQSMLSDFFLSPNSSFNNWVRLHDVDDLRWTRSKTHLEKTPIDISSPLYYASLLGLRGTVCRLLETDADVNIKGKLYGTALLAAASQAHVVVVKELLDHGACGDEDLSGALKAAFTLGHSDIVDMLLKAPSDLQWKSKCFADILHKASQGGDNKTITRLLLQTGADAILQGELATGLQHACEKGYERTAKLLLEKGADPNAGNEDLPTALQYASFRGHEGIVRLLLSKHLDTSGRRGIMGTALQSASHRGHAAVVSLLLENDAHSNDGGRDWACALGYASKKGHEKVVRLLLTRAPDHSNNTGQAALASALEFASQSGHEKVVCLLLRRLPEGIIGQAALATALKCTRHTGIARLLQEKGANVNFLEPEGSYSSPSYIDVLQQKPRLRRDGTTKSTRSGHYINM